MAKRFGLATIGENIRSADPLFMLIAVGAFILSGILGAYQWGLLLGFHGIKPGFAGTVARYFMGLFFNYILPGFVGGDVVRVYQASTISGKTTQAFSSTLADRMIGLLMLVLFSLSAFLLMPNGPAHSVFPVAILLFVLLVCFVTAFAVKPVGKLFDRLLSPFLPAAVREKIAAVYREMHELTRAPGTLFAVITCSFFIQFSRIGVHYLCGRAVGIEVGFVYFAMFVPVMEIIASLPISVGGIGVRESIGVTLFATLGVAEPSVVAYSLLATVAGFVGSIPGAIAFAVKK